MVSSQFHYTKRNRFMPFLLAEILNFQGSTHHIGVGSFSNLILCTLISIFFHKYTGKNKFFQNQAILHSLIRYSKGVINKTTTLKT